MLVKNIIFLQVLSLAAVLSGCASAPKTAGVDANKPLEFGLAEGLYAVGGDAVKRRIENVPSLLQRPNETDRQSGFYANDDYSRVIYYSSYSHDSSAGKYQLTSIRCVASALNYSYRVYAITENECVNAISGLKKIPAKFKKANNKDILFVDDSVMRQGIYLAVMTAQKEDLSAPKSSSTDNKTILSKIPEPLVVLASFVALPFFAVGQVFSHDGIIGGGSRGIAEFATGNPELFDDKTDAVATIEMIDDRANLNRQKQALELLKTSNSLKDFQNYEQKYPKMYLPEEFVEAKTNLAKDFFAFKLVDSYTGSEEDHSMRTLTMSATGKCKKMTKTVEILPAVSLARFYNQNFNVRVGGTLKRYYKPMAINAKDDPIVSTQQIALNAQNNYRARQVFDFGCVPITWKGAVMAQAVLAKIAKAVGAGDLPESFSTTLSGTDFEIDITKVE